MRIAQAVFGDLASRLPQGPLGFSGYHRRIDVNAHHRGGSTMRRLITGFGLTVALLATLGTLEFARAAGSLGTFPPTKGQPQPGPDGNTAVWRAQLRVRVCNVANAGTDNKVLATLNGTNYTVMDIPVNDFEQASDRTYDLLLIGVTRLADIHHLK